MRKAKAPVEDESGEAHYFDDFESEATDDSDQDVDRDPSKRRRPARQRVELRNEQQDLRKQLSDWEDYEDDFDQDGFDTKL